MTVKHTITIDATAQKVWEVLTRSEYIAQWDELPEHFALKEIQRGSVIEWEGYSRLTVSKLVPLRKLSMDLFLPKVPLDPAAYDISYTFDLAVSDGKTILEITIGDFSPLPNAQSYYDASVEFAQNGGQKIKELSER